MTDVGAAVQSGGNDTAASAPWTVVGDITAIAGPWVAALGELEEIRRSRTVDVGTYKYSYAELGDVLSHARGVLKAHDLAVFQVAEVINGDIGISTTVMHSSGAHFMFAPFRLPAGNTAQSAGSAATYGRRYSLLSILGLGTEDDDGASAANRETKQATLSAENVDRFLTAAHDNLLTAEEIGAVVLDATGGRTIDPAAVYVTEVPALREALAKHSGGADDQIRPASSPSGGVDAVKDLAAETSPDPGDTDG